MVNVSLDVTNQPFFCTILTSLCGGEPRFISQDDVAASNPTLKRKRHEQKVSASRLLWLQNVAELFSSFHLVMLPVLSISSIQTDSYNGTMQRFSCSQNHNRMKLVQLVQTYNSWNSVGRHSVSTSSTSFLIFQQLLNLSLGRVSRLYSIRFKIHVLLGLLQLH